MTPLLWKHNVVILYIAMEDKKLKRHEWEYFLAEKYLAVSENSADGNCFFESISEILYGDQQYHGMERKKICNWVKERIESLKANPIPPIPLTSCKTIEELLDQLLSLNIGTEYEKIDTVEMCKNYTYAGLHQILATCIIYKDQKLIIQIFYEFANDVTRTTYSTLSKKEMKKEIEEGTANIIYLHYSTMQYGGGHYQAIVDADIAIKKTQTQETPDELFGQFPSENHHVITQLHELGYQNKDIKKVFEEGDVLGKDIGYIMDKISTMQEESSPKGPIKASSRTGSKSPKDTRKASSQSRSNSPNNKTSKASTTATTAKAKATAATVRSNSPKDTRKASPPPTSSMSAKDRFDHHFYGPRRQETPPFPKTGRKYTERKYTERKYTEEEKKAAVVEANEIMEKIKEEKPKKKKGGNKTKKRRGRRYRSACRT
jgi:hypothetical protein